MKYVVINLFFLAVLIFSMSKSFTFISYEDQEEPIDVVDEDYEKNWDQTIYEVERSVDIHNSW